MHIGMITASYEPVVNGVTQMVSLYEKYLTSAGHRVTVFTLGKPAKGEDLTGTVRSPGIPLGKTGYHLAAGYSEIAQSKLRGVDIIHCHHPLMGLEFARRYGQAPIVFTNHTRYDLYLSSYGHIPAWLAVQLMGISWRKLTRLADAVIAPSNSIKELLIASGVDVPIEVIENGIEVRRFQRVTHAVSRSDLDIPDAAIVYTYVGRMAPEKSVLRLVDEFCKAAGIQKGIQLLGIGSGPLEKRVVRLIAQCGLADRAHFIGYVEPEQVPAYLALSDAFVSASVTEVHPLTALEAIAAGLPVIAVDSPGFRDIVTNGWSGLLVNESPGSLAQAMMSLGGDSLLRDRLAAGARADSERYEIKRTVRRTISLYRRLLAEHRHGAITGEGAGIRERFVGRLGGESELSSGGRDLREVDGRGL